MREEGRKGEMGDRKKEEEGKKDKIREEGGRGKDRGKRDEEKGEERSGGWSDSREHISPSSSSQMICLHTSQLQS